MEQGSPTWERFPVSINHLWQGVLVPFGERDLSTGVVIGFLQPPKDLKAPAFQLLGVPRGNLCATIHPKPLETASWMGEGCR